MLNQKPNAKNPAGQIKAGQGKNVRPTKAGERTFRQEWFILLDDIKRSLRARMQQWEKFGDIVKNNYQLGRRHLALGNLKDAVFRFKFVLWLNPRHADAMYYLGASYMALGKKAAATAAFKKALKLKPNFEEAAYLLTIVNPAAVPAAEMPKKMPLSLAREYFDSVAPQYDSNQLELLHYEGHIQLDNALRSSLVPGRIDHIFLELGVGTGLCGPGLRDVAAHMTGVDISSEMLARAVLVENNKGNKVYDALLQREAVEFLKECQDGSYDIILSAGMFSYMGDLQAVFEQAKRVLKDKGFFAFTADVHEGEGYRFDPLEARFRFSKSYLQELAARNGLKEMKLKDLAVYPDYAAWIGVYQKS